MVQFSPGADIQAAVGREQLRRLPDIVVQRRAIAARYRQMLQAVPGLQAPEEPAHLRSNWQSYCVRLPAQADQMGVMQELLDAGIASRRGIMCCHREAACADLPLPHPLHHSEAAQDRCILLPLYPSMTEQEQRQVVDALARACRTAVRERADHAA